MNRYYRSPNPIREAAKRTGLTTLAAVGTGFAFWAFIFYR